MASLTLRRVGGSVVATIPKTLLELLNAKEGDTVEYTFDDGKLIIESKQKKRRKLPKYDLSQLLEEQYVFLKSKKVYEFRIGNKMDR